MRYALEWQESSLRALESLPPRVRERIVGRLKALADNPRPSASAPLAGDLAGLRRLRIGDYRAAYEVDDAQGTVTIRAVGHRSRFYEALARSRD